PDGEAYPPPAWLAGGKGRRREGSHVPHATGRRGRCPTVPRQPRHGYAAVLPRGLLARDHKPAEESPTIKGMSARCTPAHIRQVGAGNSLSRLCRWFTFVAPMSVLLAEPEPSGSAGPSRRCRGCFPPGPHLLGQAAPSFCRAAATARRWVLSSHPVGGASCRRWPLRYAHTP